MSTDDSKSKFDQFLERFWRDREDDSIRPIADYIADYPEIGESIAREYLALRQEEATKDDASIGRFRLIKELGRGGQAIVWLAQDTELGREVALKLVREHGSVPAVDARFRREAEITSKLDHSGICQVYDVGHDGMPWIAMRYVVGETLSKKIASFRESRENDTTTSFISFPDDATESDPEAEDVVEPLSGSGSGPTTQSALFATIRLIEKTARALHAAHEAGVIHRDIKPGNIMVTASNDPVLLDFGLARVDEGDGPTLTMTGDLMGTPAYMSPEQLMAQRIKLDRRTDVYSLGVTLFECLTGRRPFQCSTREALYNAILTSDAPKVRSLNGDVPRDLAVVVETAMSKNRDNRYQTALDLAEDLRRIREYEPIAARPASSLKKAIRWTQRNPATSSLSLLLVLALSSGLILTMRENVRRRHSEQRARDAETQERERADELAKALNLSRANELVAAAREASRTDPGLALRLGIEASQYKRLPTADSVMENAMEDMLELRTFETSGAFPFKLARRVVAVDFPRAIDLQTGSSVFFPRWPETEHFGRLVSDGRLYLTSSEAGITIRSLGGERLLDGPWDFQNLRVVTSHDRRLMFTKHLNDWTLWDIGGEKPIARRTLVPNIDSAPEGFGRIGLDPVFSTTDTHLALAGKFSLTVLDSGSGEEVVRHVGDGRLLDFAFSPDSTRIAAVFEKAPVLVFSLDGAPDQPLRIERSNPAYVDFLEEERLMIESYDQVVVVDAKDGSVVDGLESTVHQVQTIVNDRIPMDARRCWPAPGAESAYFLDRKGRIRGIGRRGIWSTNMAPGASFRNVSASPDGEKLAGIDKRTEEVVVFGLGNDSVFQHRLSRAGKRPWAVAFGPDSSRLITAAGRAGYDSETSIWRLDQESTTESLGLHGPTSRILRVSSDGERVLINSGGHWQLVELSESMSVMDIPGSSEIVMSSDLRRACRVVDGRTIRWIVGSSESDVPLQGAMTTNYLTADFSSDMNYLVALSPELKLSLWDTETGQLLNQVAIESPDKNGTSLGLTTRAALSPDRRRWAVRWKNERADDRGRRNHQDVVAVYDVGTGKLITSHRVSAVSTIEFSPDSQLLALDTGLHPIVLDPERPDWRREFPNTFSQLKWSQDQRYVLTLLDSNDVVRATEIESGRQLRLRHGGGRIVSWGFLPDGESVITAGEDRTARVWSLEDGREITRLESKSETTGIWAAKDEVRILTSRPTAIRKWRHEDILERAIARTPSPLSPDLAETYGVIDRKEREELDAIFLSVFTLSEFRDAIESSPNLSGSAKRWGLQRFDARFE